MCSKKMRKRVVGFTLIELLVVIAIIAILAAILFPVFARAREKARTAACQSNLKQIVLGILQYAQDYDERLPGAWASGTAGLWSARIFPYVKNDQIFECPSSTRASGWGGWDWPGTPKTMYGYNCNISGKALCNRSFSLARATRPSELIIVGDIWNTTWFNSGGVDYGDGRINPVGGDSCWNGSNRCPLASGGEPARWHNGGGNYGFLDGHVKWFVPSQIFPSAPNDDSKDNYWKF